MKFKIGDTVKVIADGEIGEIVSVNMNADGIRYTITSKEVDMERKRIVHGVKHCMEEELEEADELKEVEDIEAEEDE